MGSVVGFSNSEPAFDIGELEDSAKAVFLIARILICDVERPSSTCAASAEDPAHQKAITQPPWKAQIAKHTFMKPCNQLDAIPELEGKPAKRQPSMRKSQGASGPARQVILLDCPVVDVDVPVQWNEIVHVFMEP